MRGVAVTRHPIEKDTALIAHLLGLAAVAALIVGLAGAVLASTRILGW